MEELIIRPLEASDIAHIIEIIQRDPLHLQSGMTASEYERYLDEPGGYVRRNTFVATIHTQTVGYISLRFVITSNGTKVESYSTVDVGWRRKGIGTILFVFIMQHLQQCARSENQLLQFLHRVDERIPGMLDLALAHDMEKRHELQLMRSNKIPERREGFTVQNAYTLRVPTSQDVSAGAAIYNDAFHGKLTSESVLHEFSSAEFNPDLNVMALNKEGEPVAFISSKLIGDVGQIPTIAVKSNYQRQGLGELLLIEVMNRLHKAGANEISLSVSTGNIYAIKLYDKTGFTTYATRSYYFKKIDVL